MHTLRLYADTSVLGGCLDDEFAAPSRQVIEEVRSGRFVLVLSATTLRELRNAPEEVRQLVAELPRDALEIVEASDEIDHLRDAYLAAGVVGESSRLDAEHIASATVAGVDVIVSWNFRHIVQFERIRGYHSVNLKEGYHPIAIHTPREVVEP